MKEIYGAMDIDACVVYNDKEAQSTYQAIERTVSIVQLDSIYNTQKEYDYDVPFVKETIDNAKKICALLKTQPRINTTNRGSINLQLESPDYSILILEVFHNKISYLFVPNRYSNGMYNYDNADEKEYDNADDEIITEIISKVEEVLDEKLIYLRD